MLDDKQGDANLFTPITDNFSAEPSSRPAPSSIHTTIFAAPLRPTQHNGAMFLLWALYLALLLVLAIPVFLVAHRRNRKTTIRNVAISALVMGGLMGITRYTSNELVQQCIDVGNTQCYDAGSTGILWLFAIGFTVVVWSRAWNLRGR